MHTGDLRSGGIAEVANIINGGYDCCPSSHYKSQYGHIVMRVWWFLDVYNIWTGKWPYALKPLPLNNCPLAATVNCDRLAAGNCYAACCN